MTAVRNRGDRRMWVAGYGRWDPTRQERVSRVDVFEAKPELGALGSGITLQGNALRVFDALGAWEDICDAGYPFVGLNLRAPGPRRTGGRRASGR